MWKYICVFIVVILLAYLFTIKSNITGGGSQVEPVSGAFAVITPEKTIEKYKGFNNSQTIFQQGSISKSVTALLIAILVEEGLLDWKDPADKHLHRWKINNDEVTVERLLNHTSGLHKPPSGGSNGYPLNIDPPNVLSIIKNEARWVPIPTHLTKLDLEKTNLEIRGSEMKVKPGSEFPLSEAVSSVPLFYTTGLERLDEDNSVFSENKPGDKWEYNNNNYLLLQILVEDVTGDTFNDLCVAKIFTPLNMKNTSFLLGDLDRTKIPSGHWKEGDEKIGLLQYVNLAAGGLYSTLPDMIKFCKELISPTLIKNTTMKKLLSPLSSDYGLGFMIEKDGWVGHRGTNTGWKSHYLVNPEKGLGIIYMSNYQGHPYIDWLYDTAGIHGYFR